MESAQQDEPITGAKAKKATPKPKKEIKLERFYSLEYFEHYVLNKDNIKDLQNIAYQGQLQEAGIRFSAWRIFLGITPAGSEAEIRAAMTKARKQYRKDWKKVKVVKGKKKDLKNFNPLSKSKSNPWNNFFADSEIRDQIKVDIERTFQDKKVFENSRLKNILSTILYVWAKMNPEFNYRQGMNDLLGIIAYNCIRETPNRTFEPKTKIEKLYAFLFDEKHWQADIYIMFDKLMQTGHKWMYQIDKSKGNLHKQKNKLGSVFSSGMLRGQSETFKTGLHAKSGRIFEKHMKLVDRQLYQHLKVLQVEPHIFLIRWIRCLFIREFHFDNTQIIWDGIFANFYDQTAKDDHEYVDYVCIAMIGFVKEYLLNQQSYAKCLQRLLKYPPVGSIEAIIKSANKYREMILENKADQDSIRGDSSKSLSLSPVKKPQSMKHIMQIKKKKPSQPKPQPKKEEVKTDFTSGGTFRGQIDLDNLDMVGTNVSEQGGQQQVKQQDFGGGQNNEEHDTSPTQPKPQELPDKTTTKPQKKPNKPTNKPQPSSSNNFLVKVQKMDSESSSDDFFNKEKKPKELKPKKNLDDDLNLFSSKNLTKKPKKPKTKKKKKKTRANPLSGGQKKRKAKGKPNPLSGGGQSKKKVIKQSVLQQAKGDVGKKKSSMFDDSDEEEVVKVQEVEKKQVEIVKAEPPKPAVSLEDKVQIFGSLENLGNLLKKRLKSSRNSETAKFVESLSMELTILSATLQNICHFQEFDQLEELYQCVSENVFDRQQYLEQQQQPPQPQDENDNNYYDQEQNYDNEESQPQETHFEEEPLQIQEPEPNPLEENLSNPEQNTTPPAENVELETEEVENQVEPAEENEPINQEAPEEEPPQEEEVKQEDAPQEEAQEEAPQDEPVPQEEEVPVVDSQPNDEEEVENQEQSEPKEESEPQEENVPEDAPKEDDE